MPRAIFDYTDAHHQAYLAYSRIQGVFHFDQLGPQCVGCSVQLVHAEAMAFMIEHNIRHLVVDGVPIVRTA